jgi:hypothetical protein
VKEREFFLTLDGLIDACEEAESGYRDAAARGRVLGPVFLEYSRQRLKFAEELREVADTFGARRLSADRPKTGFCASSDKDTPAIVSACQRGEERMITIYKKALESGLPERVQRVVELQYRDVKEARERLRAMEDQEKRIFSEEETPGTETEGAPD